MNSKKKIIDTLQNADKASVEKLMAEESKKNEIYAKVMERVSGSSDSDFADEVSGVEHYDRKISMTRIASIAAAAVLVTGGVLAGFKLMKNDRFNNNNSSNTESTTETENTTRNEVPYEINKNSIQHIVGRDWSYHKFSCDYEIRSNEYDTSTKSEPYTIKGSCKLDNDSKTGWNRNEIIYDEPDHEEKINNLIYEYSFNGYRIYTNETYEGDIKNKRYDVSFGAGSEEINLDKLPRTYGWLWSFLDDTSKWDIKDDKTENGRRIVTVEGECGHDIVTNGASMKFTADIDAESGIVLSEVYKNLSEEVVYEVKYTNYKFDDEAEAPMAPAEFKQFVLDGGYDKYRHSKYDLEVLDGVSPATTTVAYTPVTGTITTEAHPVPDELTGEFLRERSLNATHYYDKFSAEWTTSRKTNYGDENGPFYADCQGTIKIDNTTMTGEYNRTEFGTDGTPYDYTHFYFLNNIYITADDYIGTEYIASHKGAEYKSIDNEFLWWWTKPDRVFFEYYGGFKYICMDNERERKYDEIDYIINESEWTITGERYENGRRIASVSFSYEQLHEGQYEPMIITADVDAETGIWLANELYYMTDSGEKGMLHSSFKATNYKFDEEAEVPMTADEVMTYLDENDYGLAQSPVY